MELSKLNNNQHLDISATTKENSIEVKTPESKLQTKPNTVTTTSKPTTTTPQPKGLDCSKCKDKCNKVRNNMLNDNVTCKKQDGCSCECCGKDFRCDPGHFKIVYYCMRSNGTPSAK